MPFVSCRTRRIHMRPEGLLKSGVTPTESAHDSCPRRPARSDTFDTLGTLPMVARRRHYIFAGSARTFGTSLHRVKINQDRSFAHKRTPGWDFAGSCFFGAVSLASTC